MNIHIERYYPIVGGVLISGTYLLFFRNHSFPESLSDLFSVSVTISAISIGFIATSKSILLTMEDRRIIQQIKDLGLYTTLINYIICDVLKKRPFFVFFNKSEKKSLLQWFHKLREKK